MSEFKGSVIINRPIGEIWRFISNPNNAPVWGRGVSDVKWASSEPVGLGTTFRLRMAGRKMEARITEFEAEKRLTLKFTAGPVKGSTLTYSLEPLGGDTRLTRDLDMKLSGLWRLMGPIISRREVRDREAGVANIKYIIEAQTDAGTSPLRR